MGKHNSEPKPIITNENILSVPRSLHGGAVTKIHNRKANQLCQIRKFWCFFQKNFFPQENFPSIVVCIQLSFWNENSGLAGKD